MLNQGADPLLEDIGRELGISNRHARRLIVQLQKQGIHVQERRDGRKKRFFLQPEHRQARVWGVEFEEEEMHALAVAAVAARSELGGTPLEQPLIRAFEKLQDEEVSACYSFEPEQVPDQWHFGANARSNIASDTFALLEQSIRSNRRVCIDYYTASTKQVSRDRSIDPLLLARIRGSWLVVAYCHKRQGVRDFSLAGIQRIRQLDAYFLSRSDFDSDTYFRKRLAAVGGKDVYTVKLRVEPDRAIYFERKTYHSTQIIEERCKDGCLVVSFRVAGLDEIRSWVQSWGVGVTVMEPPELVEIVAREAKLLVERYAKPDM